MHMLSRNPSPKKAMPRIKRPPPKLPESYGLRFKSVHNAEQQSFGIVRLETVEEQKERIDGLPSFRGRKSRFKDIVEIRKRIKKLDHTLPLPRYDASIPVTDLSIETSEERLSKYYSKLMDEYIRNNPELEHTDKRIIICKPFRVRRRSSNHDEQKRTLSPIHDRQHSYPSKEFTAKSSAGHRPIYPRTLQLSQIDDFIHTTNISVIKPSTAVGYLQPLQARPVLVYGEPHQQPTREGRTISTSSVSDRKPRLRFPRTVNHEFKLEGWPSHQQAPFEHAYLMP